MEGNPLLKWHKAEIVFKAIGTILLPATLIFLSFLFDKRLEESRLIQTSKDLQSELLIQREAANAQLRKDVLQSVIKLFCAEKSLPFEQRFLTMSLLTRNFHNDFDLKPLIVDMFQDCRTTQCEERLKDLFNEIKSKDVEKYEAVGKYYQNQIWFGKDKPNKRFSCELSLDENKSIIRIFTVISVDVDWNQRIISPLLKITTQNKRDGDQTTMFYEPLISYFDTPSTNNIRLSNNERCAIVIQAMADKKCVDINLLYFPGKYTTLQERPYTEDVIRQYTQLIEKTKSEAH